MKRNSFLGGSRKREYEKEFLPKRNMKRNSSKESFLGGSQKKEQKRNAHPRFEGRVSTIKQGDYD